MKKFITVLLIALLAAGLVFASATADTALPTDVQGTVQSTDGTPIAGADVALIDVAVGNIVAQTIADADGAFLFVGIAEGDYLVAAVADGFEGATFPVTDGDLYLELVPVFAEFGRSIMPMSQSLLIVIVNDGNTPTGTTAITSEINSRQIV